MTGNLRLKFIIFFYIWPGRTGWGNIYSANLYSSKCIPDNFEKPYEEVYLIQHDLEERRKYCSGIFPDSYPFIYKSSDMFIPSRPKYLTNALQSIKADWSSVFGLSCWSSEANVLNLFVLVFMDNWIRAAYPFVFCIYYKRMNLFFISLIQCSGYVG